MALRTRGLAKGRKAPAKIRPRRPLTIDFHTHIRVQAVRDFLDKQRAVSGHDPRSWGDAEFSARLRKDARNPRSKHTNPKTRLRDMDKMGVDIQVVSMNIGAASYWADADAGQRVARACNEGIAEFCAYNPDRFVGLGAVPLQAPARAIKELEYAVDRLGLRGVLIISNIRHRDLGEPRFSRFWAKAEELGVPVYIHPHGFSQPDRLQKFFLRNTVGQPLEETLAMLSLIHEGVMEKHPRLKIVIAHGGGYLPYYVGRSDQAYRGGREHADNISKPPSRYLRQFYYDSVIFDPAMLEFLVKKVGAGKVMLGSDYPWVDTDAVGFVRKSRGLSKEAKDRILGKNAARLLQIPI